MAQTLLMTPSPPESDRVRSGPGDAALLVNPLDTDSIQDGIARLVTDAELREDLIRRGLERVEKFDAGAFPGVPRPSERGA